MNKNNHTPFSKLVFKMPMKKILITFDDYFAIMSYLKKEFKELNIEVNMFSTNISEHWINRFFFKKINKIVRFFGIIDRDTDLFKWSRFSYEQFRDRQFADRIRQFQPDLIFCIHGDQIGEAILRDSNIPRVGWWVEPEPDINTLIRLARLFDHYLSYSSEIVKLLSDMNIRSEYQSHVASSSDFYPIPKMAKDIDLLFYGSWSPWREEVLFSAYKATNNIALYGNHWFKNSIFFSKKDLKLIHRGKDIVGPNLNEIINRSKIVLGAQRQKKATTGLDTRAFDALASGALLLTDAPKDLFRHFKDLEDCIIYDSSEEVQDLIRAVIEEHVEVDKIKKSGRENVLTNSTYKTLCAKIATYIPPSTLLQNTNYP
jgi:spore maturation protein CgeB